MDQKTNASQALAIDITRAASTQTYYTIRFLADRELAPDAYRAYAYFRWVDDILDAETGTLDEKLAFLNRQQTLLEACYCGEPTDNISVEEQMLVDMIRNDQEEHSRLQSYLRNMMAVMAFDVRRRGRLISQHELSEYTRLLATAVTDALHYFIAHDCPAPCGETRDLAVRGAHIIHMLRDAVGDTATGYINIPAEYLQSHGFSCDELDDPSYRKWVYDRVQLAGMYFEMGKDGLALGSNLRRRLAGYAYIARFEWVLEAIARDDYHLRAAYPERKSLGAGLWLAWRTLSSLFGLHRLNLKPFQLAVQPVQFEE